MALDGGCRVTREFEASKNGEKAEMAKGRGQFLGNKVQAKRMNHKFAGHKLQQQKPVGQTVTRKTGTSIQRPAHVSPRTGMRPRAPFLQYQENTTPKMVVILLKVGQEGGPVRLRIFIQTRALLGGTVK